MTEPSGHVWVFGVVAQAVTAAVATMISAIRLIRLSPPIRAHNDDVTAVFQNRTFELPLELAGAVG